MTRRYGRTLITRVTEDEHKTFTGEAVRRGQTVSEWIREACLRFFNQAAPSSREQEDEQ